MQITTKISFFESIDFLCLNQTDINTNQNNRNDLIERIVRNVKL